MPDYEGVAFIVSFIFGIGLSIIIHELGHVAFGEMAGIPIRKVHIGSPTLSIGFHAFGIFFRIGPIVNSGITIPYYGYHYSKLSLILYLAGGIVANFLAVWLFLFLMSINKGGILFPIFLALAFMNLIFGFASLMPGRVKVGDVKIESDGKQIMNLLAEKNFSNERSIDGLNSYFKPYFDDLSENPKIDRDIIRAIYTCDADLNANMTAQEFVRDVEYELSRNRSPIGRRILLDMGTTVLLCTYWRQYLNYADRWSQELLELTPKSTTVRGTRALFLALNGNSEAAKLMCPDPSDEKEITQAYVWCTLSLIEFNLGDNEESQRCFTNAQLLYVQNENFRDTTLANLLMFLADEIKISKKQDLQKKLDCPTSSDTN